MDKRGAVFAVLTVIIMIGVVIGARVYKSRVVNEEGFDKIGNIPEVVMTFALEEEEIKLFIQKVVEYSSFNALKNLGDEGGVLKEQNCEKIKEHVIWKDNCYFSDNLQENFFERFKESFDEYVKEFGINKIDIEWKIDENNRLIIKTKGIIELEHKGVKYGFEPDNESILNYNFNDYPEILGKANECIRKEVEKGIARNNLFEDCKNDKDFKFEINVEDKYLLFDVSRLYNNFGDVTVRFAIPYG